MRHHYLYLFFFFFNDPATTEIYTLSLHDALPISGPPQGGVATEAAVVAPGQFRAGGKRLRASSGPAHRLPATQAAGDESTGAACAGRARVRRPASGNARSDPSS